MGRLLSPLLLVATAGFVAAAIAATVVTISGPAAGAPVEVLVRGFGPDVVDRCPTCHAVPVGRELPHEHPAVPGYHPVERFGCASCHGGEPRALDPDWAHARGREPLLHRGADGERHPERLEAGCGRCHALVEPAGLRYDPVLLPRVALGRELFVSQGCWGCHRLADVSFGERAPELSDVGARLTGDEIQLAIEDPSASPSSTTMPRFRLSGEQLAALTVFLMAQVDPGREAAAATARVLEARRPGSPPRRPRVERGMAAGADVMTRLGCAGCHRLDSGDGQVGPDLRWEGDLRGPRYVREMIQRPAVTVTGSRMPPVDLTASEVDACVDYLGRLRGNAPAEAEAGWRTICARCHGLDGRGRTAAAPYLARRPRDLSDATFFREAGTERLARAVNEGVPGSPMAAWAEALPVLGGTRVVGLLGRLLHGGALPARRRPPPVPPLQGEIPEEARRVAEGIFERECSACHGPGGRGDGPEARGMSPRPRDLGNAAFVGGQPDERIYRSIAYGIPCGPMPGHLEGYEPSTMWALVAKVRSIAGPPPDWLLEEDLWPWERPRRSARPRRPPGKAGSRPAPRREPPAGRPAPPRPPPPQRGPAPGQQ